jgi:hypothetical protein
MKQRACIGLSAVVFSTLFIGCHDANPPTNNRAEDSPGFIGYWHLFVPAEEGGPHHEYYAIHSDNSVVTCFINTEGKLIARFNAHIDGDSMTGDEVKARFKLTRQGQTLIIQDQKPFVFTRVDRLPVECD